MVICKQNTQIVSAAIQDAVNVDIFPIPPVENHIVSTDEEAIIAIHICDRGKRCADQCMPTKLSEQLRDLADRSDCRLWIFQFLCDICFYVRKVSLGFIRQM